MELGMLLLVFTVTTVVVFVNMLIGGGAGLVLIPFLIFLGLTPQQAIATGIFSFLPAAFAGTYKFHRSHNIQYSFLKKLIVPSCASALIGAFFLKSLSAPAVEHIIGACLLIVVPFIFLKDAGLRTVDTSSLRKKIGWVAVCLGHGLAALTGGGGGIFLVYTMVHFFGFTFVRANATAAPMWLVVDAVLSIFFFFQGFIAFEFVPVMMVANMLGAYWGAHTAIKKGNEFVKTVFSIVVVVLALKLLLF